jgi:hypothetical protein
MDVLWQYLRGDNRLNYDALKAASDKKSPIHDAIEVILKGVEVRLPHGSSFKDKEGHVRHEIRTRWWNPDLTTYSAAYTLPA